MNVKLTTDQFSVLLCNVINERGLQSILDELAMSARACGASETTAMRVEDCVRGRTDITPPSQAFLDAVTVAKPPEAVWMEKKRAALAELNACEGIKGACDVPAFEARASADIIAFSRPQN